MRVCACEGVCADGHHMGVVGLKRKHVCVPCLSFSNRKVLLLEAVICDTHLLFLCFSFHSK